MSKQKYIVPQCRIRPFRVEGMLCVSMTINSYREMQMEDYDMWKPQEDGIWDNTGEKDPNGWGTGNEGYGTEGF